MSYSAIYVTQTSADSFRVEDGFGAASITITAKSAEQAIDMIKQKHPETTTLEFIVCDPAE